MWFIFCIYIHELMICHDYCEYCTTVFWCVVYNFFIQQLVNHECMIDI